jgi:hypothetical protein
MLFIFATPVLIRDLWQLKTVVFLNTCLMCAVLLEATENSKKTLAYYVICLFTLHYESVMLHCADPCSADCFAVLGVYRQSTTCLCVSMGKLREY